ncbi:MAG TPA: hypothetical protein PLN21_18640 [Gemmatales bacterium]|nr:hypothetical protein [Gemmatales bacterium]
MNMAALLLSLVAFFPALPDDKEKALDLHSDYVATGLPLSIQGKYHTFYSLRLTGNLKPGSGGSGVFEFNPNGPVYDEFGYVSQGNGLPWVKHDCTLKYVKKGTVRVQVGRRLGGEEKDIEWVLYEIKGPKITSKLFLALEQNEGQMHGRLLMHDDQGKVKNAFTVWGPDPRPQEPCHPGCFPAGTKIAVGSETKAIELVKVGDIISTISKEGKQTQGKVTFIFVTKNRLYEVRTDIGTLVTTETQPLSLASGVLRAAGEFREGDQIVRWVNGARSLVTVKEVVLTDRYEAVFNLVLGEPTLFIANGYLARSKPPAVVAARK